MSEYMVIQIRPTWCTCSEDGHCPECAFKGCTGGGRRCPVPDCEFQDEAHMRQGDAG